MESTEEYTPQNVPHPLTALVEQLQERIHEVIIGQHGMIEQLLAGLLADGHILIEGVPGVAKTLTAKLLAKLIIPGFRDCSLPLT